jgi:hypothetical protein
MKGKFLPVLLGDVGVLIAAEGDEDLPPVTHGLGVAVFTDGGIIVSKSGLPA